MSVLWMVFVRRMLTAWTMVGPLLACVPVDTVVMAQATVQVSEVNTYMYYYK